MPKGIDLTVGGERLKVTRVAYSARLNTGKYAALVEQARRLGRVRGEVWQADVNAAINILHRAGDPDIALPTPHQRVKQILPERTDRHRTRLPVQDSSPATTERRANHPNCST